MNFNPFKKKKKKQEELSLEEISKEEHIKHNDAAEKKIISDVKEYGCHFGMIESDGYSPAFVFTIGLYETYNHPEIMMVGLKIESMSSILNHIHSMIKEGMRFDSSKEYEGILDGFNVQFLDVLKENYEYYLGYAGWYNKSFEFPCLQMIWPDGKGLFPWQEGFNENIKFYQPLLDRNSDFKFLEETNVAAFTTKHACDGEPILHVYHNDDGDWQFFTKYGADMEESAVVALSTLVNIDKSLNELHQLNYGFEAHRESVGEKWVISKSEVEE